MLRRLFLSGAVGSALLLPAAASAATTITVDPAATDGCLNGTCRTISQAVAAAGEGDTIVLKKGDYVESAPIVLADRNLTVKATVGEVTVTLAPGAADRAVFTLTEGDRLEGLFISVPVDGGQAVLVNGPNTTVAKSTLARVTANTTDHPVYEVADTVASGTNTISDTVVYQTPSNGGAASPAIKGGITSSMLISGSAVVAGPSAGAPLVLPGAAADSGQPVPNTLVTSSLLAQNASSDAVSMSSGPDGATVPTDLALQSALLVPGTGGSGIRAIANIGAQGLGVGEGSRIVGRRVTIAGANAPLTLTSRAFALGTTSSGPVTATFDKSIIHGAAPTSLTSQSSLLGGATTVTAAFTDSDTTDVGGGSVTVTGGQRTTDAELFNDPAKRDFHLKPGSSAIDKAGPLVTGDLDKDIDGDPRLIGAATDLGADEFNNRPPTARISATPTAAKAGQTVTFNAGASSDPEAAGGGFIKTYTWDFGDGQTASTSTPTTTHAYAAPGQFVAKVTVTDNLGAASPAPATVTIGVTDGTGPSVKLAAPAAGKTFSIFKTKKTKKKGKTVVTKTRNQFSFTGTATDESGVAKVELSIRRVSLSKVAKKAVSSCVYLDGKTSFKSVTCKKPRFFPVRLKETAFAYRTKKTAVFRAGTYEVVVRATDKAGNITTSTAVRFKLK